MPQNGQIIPTHLYPHEHVVVNDNTEYTVELPEESDDSIKMLFVFSSPKGPDGQLMTIEGGLKEFVKTFGQGPFSLYGQPYLNAYAAFNTGNIVGHCLRVMPSNASYAYIVISAMYNINENGVMTIKLKKNAGDQLTDLETLEDVYHPKDTEMAEIDENDVAWKEVKLFSVAYRGKGTCGQKISIAVSNNVGSDKENDYKNYIINVYDNFTTPAETEQFSVCFNEDAIINDEALFVDGVINDPDTGSDRVRWETNVSAFQELFDAYKDANPDTPLTLETFDPLLGINKFTRKGISNLTIDTTSDDSIALNSLDGISLEGGNDGDLDPTIDANTRNATLNALYKEAFAGNLDPTIKSKNRFPTNLILDANFDVETKQTLAALAEKRLDCGLVLDGGINCKTKNSPLTFVKNNLDTYVRHRNEQIDVICGKVRDPYSKKIVTVTDTYLLASAYPNLWAEHGGKHVPLAGSDYGVIEGFIKNSIYPVYDEDLDDEIMDELAAERINYAQFTSKQEIIRATQTTRQVKSSNLSEANNVFILLDIKRDCERLCESYHYNFSDPDDIRRFNQDAEIVLEKYEDTQVKSIEASFNKNDWEAARGILHLYVGFEHKDLVKTTIIEIDVNRGSSATVSAE